jgi:hypothetical protein
VFFSELICDFALSTRIGFSQISCLEWVRDNIAYFGGDPNHVTFQGQSAGSIGIGFLLVVPEAKGLFQRAIFESYSVPVQGNFEPAVSSAVERRAERVGGGGGMGCGGGARRLVGEVELAAYSKISSYVNSFRPLIFLTPVA